MTHLVLNCKTPDCALNSIAEILSLSPASLLISLRAVVVGDDTYVDDVEQILSDRCLAGRVVPDFSVRWFHGTRLHRNHTLMTEGLLPAHLAREKVKSLLVALSAGLERRGESPFSISASSKPNEEGPFGMLCRDAAAAPSGSNGRYLCRPELIDDIAGELLGENYRALTQRYAEESDPCIVHFVGSPVDRVLHRAIRYVYETQVEGVNSIESANTVCTCFDGGGELVCPERIVLTERLLADEVCDE